MIDMAKFKYYLRWYPFEWDNSSALWWYDSVSEEVLPHDRIDSDFCQNDDAYSQQFLLPLPMVDMVELEKAFLASRGHARVIDRIERNTRKDFDCQFKEFIDYNGLFPDWHAYEAAKLHSEAISWCRRHGIRYQAE